MGSPSSLHPLVIGRTYTIYRDSTDEIFDVRMLALGRLENGRSVAILQTFSGIAITDPTTGKIVRFERVSVSPRYSEADITAFPMPVNLVALKDGIDPDRINPGDYVDLGRSSIEPYTNRE